MNLDKHISNLLFEYDCVIMPELGGFIANYSHAKIHPVHHTFSPPARTIAFNANLRNNDGLLANALSLDLKVPYAEASEILMHTIAGLKERLDAHERVGFENIGELYLDREKHIQFSPLAGSNFLADSYGLTTFTSPAIKREALGEKISRKLLPAEPMRRTGRIPAALKWAAVVLPLISAGLWSAYHPDRLAETWSQGYAAFYGELSKPAPEKAAARFKTPAVTKPAVNAPAEETTTQPIQISTPEEVVAEPASPSWFIIAGAFSIVENAEKLTNQLRTKGFDASIIGQNRRGLYMVSLQGFNDKSAASEKMASLTGSEFTDVWLYNLPQ